MIGLLRVLCRGPDLPVVRYGHLVLAAGVHAQHLRQQAAQLADGHAHLVRIVRHGLGLDGPLVGWRGEGLPAPLHQVHVTIVVDRQLVGAPHMVTQVVAGEQECNVADLASDKERKKKSLKQATKCGARYIGLKKRILGICSKFCIKLGYFANYR